MRLKPNSNCLNLQTELNMIQMKRRQILQSAAGAALTATLPMEAMSATATTTAATTRTLVAAYYAGWPMPLDKSIQWLHGTNPWGTFENKAIPTAFNAMAKYPERFPLIGPAPGGYDESQQWVIDTEIRTAAAYGVDVFAMNWYRDEFLNHSIVNFKKSTRKSLMKFFLQWSNNSNTSKAPPSDSREYFFEGIRRAAIHMRDPSYWRIDGKPVFAIYDTSQVDRIINACRGVPSTYVNPTAAQATLVHDAFLQDLHNIVANVLAGDDTGGITGKLNAAVVKRAGVTPTSVATNGPVGSYTPSMYLIVCTGDVGAWAKCIGLQGMYLYCIRTGTFNGAKRLTHSFTEMMTACQQSYDLYLPAVQNYAPGKTFWPTTMAGFDQRPWGGTTADPLHDNCISTAAEFDVHCKQVRTALDKYPKVTAGTTFIYAWNELGEGGFITPTRDLGTTRLVSLRDRVKR